MNDLTTVELTNSHDPATAQMYPDCPLVITQKRQRKRPHHVVLSSHDAVRLAHTALGVYAKTDEQLLKAALDALENAREAVWGEYENFWGLLLPSRKPQADALREAAEKHDAVIAAIRKRIEGVP